ncbi:LLM class flavin-dependent oxidoreductase [Geodermatophilus sp. DSM 45219]|uniref:LLM class flavin-dependent oxidoreductase n=1 Tax=Geodermatophilus sp. DSM 45219 TaxID=1881103 RepID=UPI0008909D4D|nr:LLM class flavin-dependent oxidoreductase [Geodermatophilus sp. DSM 45219]SDO66339.1 Luciferase-like monooxygenase [Geodermatophilus sp. DSM 45219]
MQLRVLTEPQQGATYDDLLAVAQRTEETGFDAFFRSDHHLAMGGDGLPGPTDAWVTLGGLARETSRIRLGTLMSAATFRLPGPLAISVAQVDQMSGGRVELGPGSGWYEAELARRAAAIGRDVDELRAHGAAGTPAEVVDVLGRYREAGATRAYLQVLDLADLDHLDLVAAEVAPQLG